MRWRPLIVGFLLDLLDWMILGFLPLAGDVIDVLGVAYFFFVERLGPVSAGGLIELIPLADILPTFTALGFYAGMKGEKID